MHPAAFDPSERVKVMDSYGVDAAALYPNLGFVGPDIYRVIDGAPLEFQVGIARCYNDWVLGWEQQYPGRFIPLACIPYWDIDSAVAEIERCAQEGHKGYVMTGAPELHGEPILADRHWDRMWSAAESTGLPVSFHAGGGGQLNPTVVAESVDARRSRIATVEFLRNGISTINLLTSGILARYPRLNFVIVESGIGWIPFVLESLDEHVKRYSVHGDLAASELPSFYFRRQVYANVSFEDVTPWHLEKLGDDNILFETDFPHPTCLLKDELDAAVSEKLKSIPEVSRRKILWTNTTKLFSLNLQP